MTAACATITSASNSNNVQALDQIAAFPAVRRNRSAKAGSFAVRFRNRLITDSMAMRVGETPYLVRGRETGAQAQPEDDFVGARKRFPRRWTVASCLGLRDFLTKKGKYK
jgi:hypothetical protein